MHYSFSKKIFNIQIVIIRNIKGYVMKRVKLNKTNEIVIFLNECQDVCCSFVC